MYENSSGFAGLPAEEMEKLIEEYVAWRQELAAEKRFTGGNKLTDEGGRQLVAVNGQILVSDGSYAGAKEVLGGYFLIKADNYEQAVEICKGCPHLRLGGRIELREIEGMG
ncbi:MAG: transcription initiation protein [Acidobacteriia bacterium]|nr:transcription initiation protein [Terriglobia bacterium]